jgi:hypothetical protein
MGHLIHRLIIVICVVILCSACTPLTTVREDGSTVRHHFGYIREVMPPSKGGAEKFVIQEYTTVGLRIADGIGFGYFHERNDYIPPDCRVVIRVANKVQLNEVVRILSTYKEGELCASVSP